MKKLRLSLIGGVVLFGLILIGCNRPIPTFRRSSATPVPPTVEALALTRTSLAAQIIATLTSDQMASEQPVQQTTEAPGETKTESPASETTASSLPEPQMTPGPTKQVMTVVPASPGAPAAATSTPVTAAPATQVSSQPVTIAYDIPEVYTLHQGEFPWCLGRRYNIDPRQIMWLNGFYNGQIFYAGQPVFLPQNPRSFPGRRALRPHPATYTVGYRRETIYSIACFYGDIDPLALADINGLTPPYRLRPGQVLTLP